MGDSTQKLRDIVGYLSNQLMRGWAALLVAKHIDRAHRNKQLTSAQFFLSATFEACVESAILAFSRLAIPHKDSISLDYLLNCAQHSPTAFPHSDKHSILRAVSEHRTLLQSIEPLVETVKDYRDRTIAHLDRGYVNDPDVLQFRPPVDMREVERAFELALVVTNAYRGYLDQSALELASLEPSISEDWEYLSGLIERDNKRP